MRILTYLTTTLLLLAMISCTKEDQVTPTVIDVDMDNDSEMMIDTSLKAQDDLHSILNDLLIAHVDENGIVNYDGFDTDRAALTTYLDTLTVNEPQSSWTEEKQLAFWINAYNAFTIDLILENEIPNSILDINEGKAWDLKIAKIGEEIYTLNDIEHEIIRKQFTEPRIHFALVCAAVSCPKLLNEAYSEDNLEARLSAQAITFINNREKNEINDTNLKLSAIFDWFTEDFGDLNSYIRQYSNTSFSNDDDIEFLEYNWNLNN